MVTDMDTKIDTDVGTGRTLGMDSKYGHGHRELTWTTGMETDIE
jgi:hypothetical protein